MKWWEVVSGCDGYYTPKRFETEEEASAYADYVEEHGEDLHVSEGPYKVDTEANGFWSTFEEEDEE